MKYTKSNQRNECNMKTQLKIYLFNKNILSACSVEWGEKLGTKTYAVCTCMKLTFKLGRQKSKEENKF